MVNNAQLCEGPFPLNRQCASHTPARAKTRFMKPVKHRAAQLREPHLWCHYPQSRSWCLFLPPKTIIVSRRSQYTSTWLDSHEKSCRFSCFARCTEPSFAIGCGLWSNSDAFTTGNALNGYFSKNPLSIPDHTALFSMVWLLSLDSPWAGREKRKIHF